MVTGLIRRHAMKMIHWINSQTSELKNVTLIVYIKLSHDKEMWIDSSHQIQKMCYTNLEVFMAVWLRPKSFWDMLPRHRVTDARHFKGKLCLQNVWCWLPRGATSYPRKKDSLWQRYLLKRHRSCVNAPCQNNDRSVQLTIRANNWW